MTAAAFLSGGASIEDLTQELKKGALVKSVRYKEPTPPL
jgi:hypothetical protein